MLLLECKNSTLFYQINSLIIEYMELNGLTKALDSFMNECNEKCLPFPSTNEKQIGMQEYGDFTSRGASFTQNEAERMLIYFELGKRQDFFQMWEMFLEQIHATNDDIRKLEVYLHVHFALWPKAQEEPEEIQVEAMNVLRVYFEKHSTELANEAAILPLFALPFVADPKNHPIFCDLFETSWTGKLKKQLESTLIKYFEKVQENISSLCKLAEIVNSSNLNERSEMKEIDMDCTRQLTPYNDLNSNYHRDRFAHLAGNYRQLRRILRKTRENYRKILKVSNELVVGLEKTLQGDIYSIEPVLERCFEIFPELFCSDASSKKPDKEYFKRITKSHEIDQNLDSEVSLFIIGISDMTPVNLDYEKIKSKLISEDIPYSEKLCLIQSLRWLITRSSSKCREDALECYANHDILGINNFPPSGEYRTKVFAMLVNPQPNYMKECLARLLNAIASTKMGREYLSRNNNCLDFIITALSNFNKKGENESMFIYQMILAALQKLSLRKKMRLEMIKKNIIQMVVGFMKSELDKKPLTQPDPRQNDKNNNSDPPILNLYLIEYGWALLMNLCLHSESDKAISEIPGELLTCIIQILFYRPKHELGTYVVSTLYSILKNHDVYQVATKLNLTNCLETIISNDGSELSVQLIHILNSLHNREMLLTETLEVEYDDEDCVDPEDFEPEIECEEKWADNLQEGSLTGDDLLINNYYLNNQPKNLDNIIIPHPSFAESSEFAPNPVLKRPTTPLKYTLLLKNLIKAKEVMQKRSSATLKNQAKKDPIFLNDLLIDEPANGSTLLKKKSNIKEERPKETQNSKKMLNRNKKLKP